MTCLRLRQLSTRLARLNRAYFAAVDRGRGEQHQRIANELRNRIYRLRLTLNT